MVGLDPSVRLFFHNDVKLVDFTLETFTVDHGVDVSVDRVGFLRLVYFKDLLLVRIFISN